MPSTKSYYRQVPRNELSDAALKGVVAKLDDRFSAYFSPKEYAQFSQAINNEFSGVGIAVRGVEAGLRIETVYPKSPAEKAGIEVGDVIVSANGRKLGGLSETAATTIIKGREGTRVTLRLRRDGRTFVKRVTRATITIPVVAVEDRQRGRRARGVRRAVVVRAATGRTSRWRRRSASSCGAAPRGSCSTCAATAAASSARRSSSRACSCAAARS